MRLNDNDVFENRCPEFKQTVEDIIKKDRETEMQERSQRAATKTLHMNETQNERTLFGKMRPLVIPKERTIKTTKHDLAGELVLIYGNTKMMDFKDRRLSVCKVVGTRKGFYK